MKKEIVIFGAGNGGIKIADTLRSFGIDFYCFLDNDSKKWGSRIRGKEVKSPNILKNKDYEIIIASEYQDIIEKQLEKMGKLNQLVLKEDYILSRVELLLDEIIIEQTENKKKKVIVDLMEGVQLGGIETWTYNVTRELKKRNVDVCVYAGLTENLPEEDIRDCFKYYDIQYIKFKENVIELTKELLKDSPCTVIINKHTQLLYAAHLAKQIAPDRINVISVIHSDSVVFYRRQKRIDEITDKVICVSKRIRKKLIYEYKVSKRKVFYKESPVSCEKELSREYSIKNEIPIKIGYAGRLVKLLKRADLLLELIDYLEEYNCHYIFSVAGEGSYKIKIEEYIKRNNLQEKVKLVGQLTSDEINKFWENQDIFVSVSDREGVGLSMLEAMSKGCVPIETNVSGADEFIYNNMNGYVVDVGNILDMAKYILYLDQNRNRLTEMGHYSYKLVKKKCKLEDYIDFIMSLCE